MMTAYLIVRAEVAAADRDAFDHWYETEHLPDAMAAFGTTKARRGWSNLDPGVHLAIYEFDNLERARKEIANLQNQRNRRFAVLKEKSQDAYK